MAVTDLEEYARVYVALARRPHEREAVLAELGKTEAWFAETQRLVNAGAELDPRVAAEVNARVIIAHNAMTPWTLAPTSVARVVRARRCPRCGGYKRIEARTAHVYCDYCAYLFDYDEDPRQRAASLAGQKTVLDALTEGVSARLRHAFETHDDDTYRALWRWPYAMDMLLVPRNWSPRIGDETYRNAILDFCAESCLLFNRSEARRNATTLRLDAKEDAKTSLTERSFRAYVASVQNLLSVEIDLFRRAGLLERHPDQLDEETFRYINVVQHMLDWRGVVSDEIFVALLRMAKVDVETASPPNASIGKATCASCHDRLLLVEGARSIVCEACGHLNDCQMPVPCPNCGAVLLTSRNQVSVRCGYCSAVSALL